MVMIGLFPNPFSCCPSPPAGLGMAPGILSDDKEGRFYSILLQYVENLRGVRFVGPVVQGQCNPQTVAVAIRTYLAIEPGARVDAVVSEQCTRNTNIKNVNESSHCLERGADIHPE